MYERVVRDGQPQPDLPREREDDVVEVPLLLPGWQVQALAEAAQARGQTAGEMLRQMLRSFLTQPDQYRLVTH
jgi:hypothetical protein